MIVRDLIKLLTELEDEAQDFNIVMAPDEDSDVVWSLDQISVAMQRNSHPPRGFILFESVVENDSDAEPEVPVADDGVVPGTFVG